MTIRNTYSQESWDKVYSAFDQINFTAFDYDSVKESLIAYLKLYHAEHFNDFIESSEMIMLVELFAYVAELLAYRVDMMSHENFISTAQRKQSILKLAKSISYNASRNIPARGLVKINSIRTSEDVFDSLGNNLANVTINWNDSTNENWKEQFFLVIGKSLNSKIGFPNKSFQIGDVQMDLYSYANDLTAFRNGVSAFTAVGNGDNLQMELVPADIDSFGPFERSPDSNAQFSIIYANDGRGDSSDYTGFLMMVKQGSLIKTIHTLETPIPNRTLELDIDSVNNSDVWVFRIDDNENILESWEQIDSLSEQNLYFNTLATRKKYSVETLEGDKIALHFGDGNFSDAPVGTFQIWTRTSLNQNVTIPKNRIFNQPLSFNYQNPVSNNTFTLSLAFSLTSALQNNAPSETVEHIRQTAPSVYATQNRMVSAQDYNTYLLKDSSIIRLKTLNRTFAGQPKYLEWNDASGAYQNVKVFGDDLTMFMDISAEEVTSSASARNLIDSIIEPELQTNHLLNTLTHVLATSDGASGIISYPRRKFIEDSSLNYRDIDGNPVYPYGKNSVGFVVPPNGSLKEKSAIQAAIDGHWYGEPLKRVQINGVIHGVIPDPLVDLTDDSKIYDENLPLTIDGINSLNTTSGIQQLMPYTYFGLRFNRFLAAFGNGNIVIDNTSLDGLNEYQNKTETITFEMSSDKTTFSVVSNIRGKLPDYSLNGQSLWSQQNIGFTLPFDCSIVQGTIQFEAGDAFVIDLKFNTVWTYTIRPFGNLGVQRVNLNGWWEVIPQDIITAPISSGGTGLFQLGPDNGPSLEQQMTFDADTQALSWVFLVAQSGTKWKILNRSMKIIARSPTTKFWYNSHEKVLDANTGNPVSDKIRVLRSNIHEADGTQLKQAQIYDVVGPAYDNAGNLDNNAIEVVPSLSGMDAQQSSRDNLLQFEDFSSGSFQYGYINDDNTISWLSCSDYKIISGYELFTYDSHGFDGIFMVYQGVFFQFLSGQYVGTVYPELGGTTGLTMVRRQYVPAPASQIATNNNAFGCNLVSGLDFMWQHFTPHSNLIDPSTTNIHDAYIMTNGYYLSSLDYVNGVTNVEPTPPTPFELRTSYSYLLKNKMLSDTVVLHSGKFKFLFGELADQKNRAKFRVVRSPSSNIPNERIKSEVISVVNSYFDIQNWDFGDTFYATELLSLIHQRLSTHISSVVLVPTYSANSFGSLFTIESGFDEILQSAAKVTDVEIVQALTPSTLRQIR